jgi:Zinc dependent phospholipase C
MVGHATRRRGSFPALGACSVVFLFVLVLLSPSPALAWMPGAHWALAQNVAKQLPVGNPIRAAMLAYPNDVAWGSIGPDLPANNPMIALGNVPWFDTYHYDNCGPFAAELMREALASTDPDRGREIAFAAGWITHAAGDMAVHGIYVNPEAGVYIDRGSNHTLHRTLEGWAEPYVWTRLAGLSARDYSPRASSDPAVEKTKLYRHFLSDMSSGTIRLLDRVNRKIVLAGQRLTYLERLYFGPSQIRSAEAISRLMLATPNVGAVAYLRNYLKMYLPLSAAMPNLTTLRLDRIQRAWTQSNEVAKTLLVDASKGDYSWYSDSWVLDAGMNDGRTVGNMKLVIQTSDRSGAGTDKVPYFGIEFADGAVQEWKLEHGQNRTASYVGAVYNDFERGSRDVYYLHSGKHFSIPDVRRIYLRLGSDGGNAGPDWWWDNLTLRMNNRVVYQTASWPHHDAPGTKPRQAWHTTGDHIDAMFGSGWPQSAEQAAPIRPPVRRFEWVRAAADPTSGQIVLRAKLINAEWPRISTFLVDGKPVATREGTGLAYGTFDASLPIKGHEGSSVQVAIMTSDPFGTYEAIQQIPVPVLP